MKKDVPLRPTLWRTVRAVLNEQRLRLLRDVFAHDGRFCVRELAKRAGLDEPVASNYLRQLNARGLLGVRRDRIKVFYTTETDRSLPEAVYFQAALRSFLSGRLQKGWELELMTVLRGFAHFNRLAILLCLAKGPATYDELCEAMGVCVKNFYHHLAFLHSAGLADKRFVDGEKIFVLVKPVHPLSICLMEILLADESAEVAYFNPGHHETPDQAEMAVLRKLRHLEGFSGGRWAHKKTMRTRSRRMSDEVIAALEKSEA